MESLPTEEVRLGLLADAMRNRWRTIVLTALLVGALGALVVLRLPVAYTSTTDVLLNPTPGNALTTDSSRSGDQINVAMQTEAGLVKSPPVADIVAVAMREKIEAAASEVEVSVPPNTQIVRIEYTGDSPRTAQRFASAYADALLQYRRNQAESNVTGQLDLLKQQSDTASAGLKKAAASAGGTDPSAEAVAQVQLYTNRLATLQDQIGTLEATPVAPGTVVTPASLATAKDGLPVVLLVVVAVLLGLVLGLGLAIWRERTDDHIRSAADADVESLSVMGLVPAGLGNGNQGIVTKDGGALADAYRGVRASLFAQAPAPAVVVVAGLDETLERAGHRVAVNLATSIAVSGHSVCLVDATLADGSIEELTGVEGGYGLADAIADSGPVRVPVAEAWGGYHVVTGGSVGRSIREQLASNRLREVLDHLAARHEYVVVAAPVISLSETNELALASTGVVLVAADRRSLRDDVRRTVRRVGHLGISVLGLVSVQYARREHEAPVVAKQVEDTAPVAGSEDLRVAKGGA
ncbi:hypothetical protein PDTK01_32320 [Phycicoccus sp. DTK01]|nr:hypothetical protein PDTK01_32320 [Phycicoccus sp. DTK01]